MLTLLLVLFLTTPCMAQNVQVTAHRGASGHAPENTVSSVRKALEMGVDRIEIDVQQTSDGKVILLHDKTLDRTTDSKGKVANMTYDQLKGVKAHGGFQQQFPDESIPLLEDVFQLMDGTTEFVIEIKAGSRTYPGIEDNVAALIKKYKAEKWALVHSFNDRVLRHLHAHHPEIRLQKLFVSYSAGIMLDFRLHAVALSKYDYVEGFGIGKGGVNAKLVNQLQQMGKTVHVWTVNKEEEMMELIGLGVNGIITNYPEKAKAVIGSK